MPHALFLGSFLATQNRVAGPPEELPYPVHAIEGNNMGIWARLRGFFSSLFSVSRAERIAASREYRNKYGRENNELGFIQAHLPHGLVDVISSLICVAVPINSAYVRFLMIHQRHAHETLIPLASSSLRRRYSFLTKTQQTLGCSTHMISLRTI